MIKHKLRRALQLAQGLIATTNLLKWPLFFVPLRRALREQFSEGMLAAVPAAQSSTRVQDRWDICGSA